LVVTVPAGGYIVGVGAPESIGVHFAGCTAGVPTVTGEGRVVGGYNRGLGETTNVGIDSDYTCAPVIDTLQSVWGCGDGPPAEYCIGVWCRQNSQCVIRNNPDIVGGWMVSILGVGVRCERDACARIDGNTIWQPSIGSSLASLGGTGLELLGANPPVNDNHIIGPSCQGGMAGPDGKGVYLMNSAARLTNNVIEQGRCPGMAVDILPGSNLGGPTLHSNTIEGGECWGTNVGVNILAGTASPPTTVLRNNIIRGIVLPCPLTFIGLWERTPEADPAIVENNAFYNAPDGLYIDEMATMLISAAEINALDAQPETTAFGNIDDDCLLDATWHLPAGSLCIDAGTSTNAPPHDFDPGGMRPVDGDGSNSDEWDIGADEFGTP
ncbi:MAG: hypothetical protein JSV65_01600, partial [Armatimonadota bacterium]